MRPFILLPPITMAKATATQAAMLKKSPIERFHDRGVSLAIFPNAVSRDDGSAFTFYNTVIESRYKDKDNQWQSSSSFSKDQLFALRFLVDEALRAITAAERRQDTSDE